MKKSRAQQHADCLASFRQWLCKWDVLPPPAMIAHEAVVHTYSVFFNFLRDWVIADPDNPPLLPEVKGARQIDQREPFPPSEIWKRFELICGYDAREANVSQLGILLAEHVQALWPEMPTALRQTDGRATQAGTPQQPGLIHGYVGIRLADLPEEFTKPEPPPERVRLTANAKTKLAKLIKEAETRLIKTPRKVDLEAEVADLRRRLGATESHVDFAQDPNKVTGWR